MKRVFLQVWQADKRRTGSYIAVLSNGFHYVWDEAQPIWMEMKHGAWDIIPDGDEIYLSCGGYASLARLVEWAKRSPEQKFIAGGTAVRAVHVFPVEKLPPNFSINRGLAEELFNKEPNPFNFKLIPPKTEHPIFYTYPYFDHCKDWGKCKYCTEPTKDKNRKWSLEPLENAPDGEVITSCPSMLPEDIEDLGNINWKEKTFQFGVRASDRTLPILRNLAKKIDASRVTLRIGVEFPSNRMLQYMNKGIDRETYARFLVETHEMGYQLGFAFITGWGNITPEDLEEAKIFFNDIKRIWNRKVYIVHTPLIAYMDIAHRFEHRQLSKDPVLVGPFLVGYYMYQSPEQLALDADWKKMVMENGHLRTIGQYDKGYKMVSDPKPTPESIIY